uniref:Vacuolar ATPase assembly integral membrane protein VMA21 n=1 Tax=Steinernema glaseri TaxID=37863 RepID=A0A1I7XVX8_9BILA
MSRSGSESERSRSRSSSQASLGRRSLSEGEEEIRGLEVDEEESPKELQYAQLDPAAAKAHEEEQAQFYTPLAQHKAVSNLVFYSIMMFVFPLGVMFGSYHVIFLDYFGYDSRTASLYAGITAAVAVYIVIICFIYTAYREEADAEKEKLEKKKE